MAEKITVVGLGEALWDLLPSGKKVGGAPLNVACHAHQLLRDKGGQGASDTCSAAILVGAALQMPPIRIAAWANQLGAFVASQPGSTPEVPSEIIDWTC